ncbi:unnamed protein product [Caenorhabditis angaria]|uniref:BAM-2-like concanavalin A-like domain-containing protein n=1 Tax=Caenorhabditis angaria TaxID=860376 RepID=A0A9P1I4V2_9PELO|nr:unnamed protein product [Caenorhabditis angaria]
MRRRIVPPLAVLLILLSISSIESGNIQPRWSCYHHYLAGIRKSAVLPISASGSGSVSNVKCIFEKNGNVITEIHSALENSYQPMSKKSVNYQVADLYHLRELIDKSDCSQNLSIFWSNQTEFGRGSISVVSLLNVTTQLDFNGQLLQEYLLDGKMAGVRHMIPNQDNYEFNPFLATTRLICKPKSKCIFNGEIEGDLSSLSYSFAFRTDQTNQTLFNLNSEDLMTNSVKLENDYFIRIGNNAPVPIYQLSDSKWHTVAVRIGDNEQFYLRIDNSDEIEMKIEGSTKKMSLLITVTGEIQLIDPVDAERCNNSEDTTFKSETVRSSNLCEGCGCGILSERFDGLSRCFDDSDGSFTIRRDIERLSFLHVDNAFDINLSGAAIPSLSATFKSDSDAGLVLFGYWQNSKMKGRLQVYYHFDLISAVYCEHNSDEEECYGCSIRDSSGFGRDQWIQTILWGGGELMYLGVDTKICQLQATSNVSLSDVYSVPSLTHGSGLFIGGTWHEKKRRGLYRADAEQKYFENTREKAPVLRGCVKDVFVRGTKVDLNSIFSSQRDYMLIETADSSAFAVKPGCSECEPNCDSNVRCRSRTPLASSPLICDCSDVLQFNNSYGFCQKKLDVKPVVLSTKFLSQKQIIVDVQNTKAVLSKVWLKFSLPKIINEPQIIAEFNSHRETLFNIKVDNEGTVQVQLHGQEDDPNAARKLSLLDDRVHLLKLERRTPIGTRHNAKKYDLYIDGWHSIVSDIGKLNLNNISVLAIDDQDELNSVIIHDFGLGYEYDEHFAILHSSNNIHQIDIHSKIFSYQFLQPDLSKTGVFDDSLWETPIEENQSNPLESSPYGQVVDFTADIIEPEQLLSARWILYSLFLTILLCLLILICIVCYVCLIRKRSLSDAGSQRTIMRDSPDYGPVKLRTGSIGGLSLDDDTSIGTDDTDLQAYRDIPSHRVKIYRESMVSILVPSIDQPAEAAIVKRPSSSVSADAKLSDTHAPLVKVNDD